MIENKKVKIKNNICNPYTAANNYHLTKHHQTADCLNVKHEFRLLKLSLVRI